MPYQRLLDGLVSLPGAQGALLLDAEGERVVEAGARDHRHRLIGAYQGIALTKVRRTAERYRLGPVRHLVCRYDWGTVILRPLKDGYYLILSLAPEAAVGPAVFHTERAQEEMNQAL